VDTKEFHGELRDWRFGNNYHNVMGTIYGDTKGRFNDGDLITTSTVRVLNLEEGWVQTRNSLYKLGEEE
jgi:hypothetical protein